MNMLPNEAMKFIEDLAPLVKDTKNGLRITVSLQMSMFMPAISR